MQGKEETTPMFPMAQIVVLLHLQAAVSLYVIPKPKKGITRIRGPQRLLPSLRGITRIRGPPKTNAFFQR
jgi:hypothetical protein